MASECPTGKFQHETRAKAKRAVKRIEREIRELKISKFSRPHPYLCGRCGMWHLTAKPT